MDCWTCANASLSKQTVLNWINKDLLVFCDFIWGLAYRTLKEFPVFWVWLAVFGAWLVTMSVTLYRRSWIIEISLSSLSHRSRYNQTNQHLLRWNTWLSGLGVLLTVVRNYQLHGHLPHSFWKVRLLSKHVLWAFAQQNMWNKSSGLVKHFIWLSGYIRATQGEYNIIYILNKL